MSNFWDTHAGTVEEASMYMASYGEGVGSDTRKTLCQFILDGESVLDVGCGPGWNYEHFKEFGPKVSDYKGTDYSEVMIEGAKMKYPEANFEVGDVRDIQEPDESWDVVLLQDVLEHTNGYEKPLEDAVRVAKKRIIVTFWHLIENGEHINDDGNDGWGAWYERGKWEKFLDSLGYRWVHLSSGPGDNRAHDFYIIYKESLSTT
jgi:ubiquinone/menaquinone biosynthesis C-methylase UbiE